MDLRQAKVAPRKQMTIPQLELMAALVAVKISAFVKRAMEVSPKTTNVWSDSQIVLEWIKGNHARLPKFVQNRVKMIEESGCTWRYCPTEDNPSDIGTQGMKPDELEHCDLWHKGPEGLKNGKWPKEEKIKMDGLDKAEAIMVNIVTKRKPVEIPELET